MATAIENDARNNFNRRGLPAGYNPIAPEHIFGYTTPPVRMRSAGSLADPGTWKPLVAIAAAFVAAVYVARENVRENPGPAFTTKQAKRAGDALRVNYARLGITPTALRVGMNVEREHSNVTHGSPTLSAKIALAHLKEAPNYYRLLKAAGL